MKTFGALLASGHDLDTLLDRYSFDQIGLMASALMIHKIDMLNMIAGPLLGGLGVDYKPAGAGSQTRRKPKKGSHRNADYKDDEAKEAAMNRALGGLPVRVRTRKSPGDSEPANG